MGIAIGGDGSFLRMVKKCNFNPNVLYVGINSGTLGFAQEVGIEEIDFFIEELKDSKYKIDDIGIEEINVITGEGTLNFNALNEIVIREKDLNTLFPKLNKAFHNPFVPAKISGFES